MFIMIQLLYKEMVKLCYVLIHVNIYVFP